MVDTPVVVRALADGEDLILQGVGVVADDTELDVHRLAGTGTGRHFTWFGMLVPKPKNG